VIDEVDVEGGLWLTYSPAGRAFLKAHGVSDEELPPEPSGD
jgi:hypothetical protein